MASCVRNICAKSYTNLVIFVQIRIENFRDVLRHSVVIISPGQPTHGGPGANGISGG